MTEETSKERNCCPICGIEFDEVVEVNKCGTCGVRSSRDSLITEDDDYAWVI